MIGIGNSALIVMNYPLGLEPSLESRVEGRVQISTANDGQSLVRTGSYPLYQSIQCLVSHQADSDHGSASSVPWPTIKSKARVAVAYIHSNS